MELSNDSKTIEVPNDIKVAIENYKNQATLLGLEVERVRKLKAQIEISISNLTSIEVSKIERNRSLGEKISKQTEQINEFETKKAQILKEKLEFDQFKNEETKKLNERETEIKRVETLTAKKATEAENKQKNLDQLIIRYEEWSAELTKKKNLISDLIKKI